MRHTLPTLILVPTVCLAWGARITPHSGGRQRRARSLALAPGLPVAASPSVGFTSAFRADWQQAAVPGTVSTPAVGRDRRLDHLGPRTHRAP